MSEPSPQPDFYVGYLPVPAGLRRFLRIFVPAILWLLLAAAFFAARSQPDPGPAVWDDGKPRTLSGIISARPYPALYTSLTPQDPPCWVLLVEPGKHSTTRATPFDGQHARLSGWILHRDNRAIVELDPSPIQPDPASSTPPPAAPRPLGRVTLRGEIVDSKCYLGAMKPGDGKTHKECATLCISGGIPPVFVTRTAQGDATYYLLISPTGDPLDPACYPYIGEPVEVRGDLDNHAGLLRLRLAPSDIRRL